MAVKVETLKQVGTQQPGKPRSYYVGTLLRYLLLALIGLILFMPFILAAWWSANLSRIEHVPALPAPGVDRTGAFYAIHPGCRGYV